MSKAILSFGYLSYLKLYFNSFVRKCFTHAGSFCACCKITSKHSKTGRKYLRAKNGEQKIFEETDLIQIVKTLRQARFLIDLNMDAK